MGKLGGRELNVSSDIDLIFVYPEDGETDGPGKRIDNFDFFTRLGRKLIGAAGRPHRDGRLPRRHAAAPQRRLRPAGGSFDMLENYFITQGREWERYAWIKARAADRRPARRPGSLRKPFVFRKYLDFGAINAMRDLHAQIRREVARRDMADNVKLGPGGIREIEFIAQVFQLIRGGRDKRPADPSDAAGAGPARERGILTAETVRELNAPTFPAPAGTPPAVPRRRADPQAAGQRGGPGADRPRMGLPTMPRCWPNSTTTAAASAAISTRSSATPNRRATTLARCGTAAEQTDECRAANWCASATRTRRAAHRLAGLQVGQPLPADAGHLASASTPLVPRADRGGAVNGQSRRHADARAGPARAISRRAAYLALLQQYPQALQKVARAGRRLELGRQYLVRHPILLDELLDSRAADRRARLAGLRAQLAARAARRARADTERQMDTMRERTTPRCSACWCRTWPASSRVERLSDHLSALADIMLDSPRPVLAQAQAPLRRPALCRHRLRQAGRQGAGLRLRPRHGLPLRRRRMNPPRPTPASRSAPTPGCPATPAAGILFETDLRLRPNGESGLLVSSVEAFRQYQLESAWVWEHQALTRARFSAGDAGIGRKFEAIRIEVLRQPATSRNCATKCWPCAR
jgi:glutamate-ammonia-ligase adenylyltransferase